MKTTTITAIITATVISISAAAFYLSTQKLESYDEFTSCLRDSGVVMFGASWCPACAEQKKNFERGAKSIPYFECSPDGASNPQAQECTDRGVVSYPTWQFNESYLETVDDSTWEAYATAYNESTPEEDKVEGLSNFEKFKALVLDGRKVYNNGRFSRGVLSLEDISLYSGCPLPEVPSKNTPQDSDTESDS